MKNLLFLIAVMSVGMLLVGCSKNESPKQIMLPTEVIKQDPPVAEEIPTIQNEINQDDNDNQNTSPEPEQQEPVEEFDPVVFEQENDGIQELVDILEELIEEQES